jgi:hypothetical protein
VSAGSQLRGPIAHPINSRPPMGHVASGVWGPSSVMRHHHRPEDEKRMIVVLPGEQYEDWLNAPADMNTDSLNPNGARRSDRRRPRRWPPSGAVAS